MTNRVGLCCGWLALCLAAAAQGQVPEPVASYFVGDEEIPLIESMTHKSIVVPAAQGQVDPAVLTAIGARGDVIIAATTVILDDDRAVAIVRAVDGATDEQFSAAVQEIVALDAGARREAPVYVYADVQQVFLNRFVIQFTDASQAEIDELLDAIDAVVLLRYTSADDRYRIEIPDIDPGQALDVVNGLRDNPIVDFAEPSFIRYRGPQARSAPDGGRAGGAQQCTLTPLPQTSPSDTHLADQWALDRTDAFDAWGITQGAPAVVVAVLDYGVDTQHDDLMGKIVSPFDATPVDACGELGTLPDNDQEPNPWDKHGTEMAGIATASTNNQTGIAGVSWHSMLMPIRIIQSDINGGEIWDEYPLYCGIKTAVDRGATVINASWFFGTPSTEINDEIDNALALGRVFVAATGNYTSPNPTLPPQKAVRYPASRAATTAVIAVGASNLGDVRKEAATGTDWGSSYGAAVSLVAPGECIRTTWMDSNTNGHDDYAWSYGTSAATALVSGAAALLKAKYPGASPLAIRDWLQRSADPVGYTIPDNDIGHEEVGHGRLDIDGALAVAEVPYLSIDTRGSCEGLFDRRLVIEVQLRQGGRYGPPISGAQVTFELSGDARTLTRVAATDEEGKARVEGRVRRSLIRVFPPEFGVRAVPVITASAAGIEASAPVCDRRPD